MLIDKILRVIVLCCVFRWGEKACGKTIEDSDERTQDARTKKYFHLHCALDLQPTADAVYSDDEGDGDGAGALKRTNDGSGAGAGVAAPTALLASSPPPNPPATLPTVGGTAGAPLRPRPDTSGAQPSARAGAAVFGGVASSNPNNSGDDDDGSDSVSLGSSDTDSSSSSSDDDDSDSDSDGEIVYDNNGNIIKHGNKAVYVNGKLVE